MLKHLSQEYFMKIKYLMKTLYVYFTIKPFLAIIKAAYMRNSIQSIPKSHRSLMNKTNRTVVGALTLEAPSKLLDGKNSPKNLILPRNNDFYSFQKKMMSSIPQRKDSHVRSPPALPNNIHRRGDSSMRKTFSIAHSRKSTSLNHSQNKQKNKAMNATTSSFRPPTSIRRSDDETEQNFLNKYEIIKQLGKGMYGLVLLAKLSLKNQSKRYEENPEVSKQWSNKLVLPKMTAEKETLYAIKVYQKFKMNKDPAKFKNIRKQINIMLNIEHPNIIKLYESVDTLTKISLVVEYGGKCSLFQHLKSHFPLTMNQMRSIGKQILSAIAYLHEHNIVHRDLKLQNVLVRDGIVKLIDFGFSTITHKRRKLHSICGTPNYMAPQLLSRKEYNGEEADMWAYGIIMFALGEGRLPFRAENIKELERVVKRGKFQFRRVYDIEWQQFIKKILKTKPSDRPRASNLIRHLWFIER